MEKAMAPHSSTLALKIPWTEEPGRVPKGFSEVEIISVWSLYLQGGVDDELTLSANITIALLEMPLLVTVGTHHLLSLLDRHETTALQF